MGIQSLSRRFFLCEDAMDYLVAARVDGQGPVRQTFPLLLAALFCVLGINRLQEIEGGNRRCQGQS